jgi:hypothetical protein
MQAQKKETHISSLKLTNYSVKPGYALYTIQIMGNTAFMPQHQISAIYYKAVRYSQLLQLHKSLRTEYAHYCSQYNIIFPLFPPKKYFNRLGASFLEKRLIELNQYFSKLFELLPQIKLSSHIYSLCLPLKTDILICGSSEVSNNAYIAKLAQLLISASSVHITPLEYFAHKDAAIALANKSSSSIPDFEKVPPSEVQPFKSAFAKYINNKHSYTEIFPCDYIFHEHAFRINIEEQSMPSYLNAAMLSNRAVKWVENNAAMMVIIDLSNKESIGLASLIIDKLKELASHSHLPMVVLIGMCNENQHMIVSDEDIHSLLISKKSEYLPLKYFNADVSTGENVVEGLHYILYAREKKEK